MFKNGSIFLFAAVAISLSFAGDPTATGPRLASSQDATQRQARIAGNIRRCEKAGFYANTATGNCTDVPLPAALR